MGGTESGEKLWHDYSFPQLYSMRLWFETNGASAPVVVSAGVEQVQRLTSVAGREFYRATISGQLQDQLGTVWGSVRVGNDLEAADDFEGVVPLDRTDAVNPVAFQMPVSMLSPGGPTRRSCDFDVAVRNGATRALTNQVPAGRRVYVKIEIDRSVQL